MNERLILINWKFKNWHSGKAETYKVESSNSDVIILTCLESSQHKSINQHLVKYLNHNALLLLHSGEGPDGKESQKMEHKKIKMHKGCLVLDFTGGYHYCQPYALRDIYYDKKNRLGLLDAADNTLMDDCKTKDGEIKKERFDFLWNRYFLKEPPEDLLLGLLLELKILSEVSNENKDEVTEKIRRSIEERDILELIKKIDTSFEEYLGDIPGWITAKAGNSNFFDEFFSKIKKLKQS